MAAKKKAVKMAKNLALTASWLTGVRAYVAAGERAFKVAQDIKNLNNTGTDIGKSQKRMKDARSVLDAANGHQRSGGDGLAHAQKEIVNRGYGGARGGLNDEGKKMLESMQARIGKKEKFTKKIANNFKMDWQNASQATRDRLNQVFKESMVGSALSGLASTDMGETALGNGLRKAYKATRGFMTNFRDGHKDPRAQSLPEPPPENPEDLNQNNFADQQAEDYATPEEAAQEGGPEEGGGQQPQPIQPDGGRGPAAGEAPQQQKERAWKRRYQQQQKEAKKSQQPIQPGSGRGPAVSPKTPTDTPERPRDIKKELDNQRKQSKLQQKEEKIQKGIKDVAEKKGEDAEKTGGIMSMLRSGKADKEAEKASLEIAFGALATWSPAAIAAFAVLNGIAIYHLQGGKRFKFDLKQTIILAFVNVMVGLLLIILLTLLLWMIDIITGNWIKKAFDFIRFYIFKSGPTFL